jgi:hypothetical protein
MKRTLLFSTLAMLAFTLFAQEQIEVITGAGYVNDVYYSLENGVVDSAAMNDWDIAFTTGIYSVSVLANTCSGVELYTYTLGKASDWATMDTTGMAWIAMYNSLETFDEGAFNFNATGHPDYGWGVYGGGGLLAGDSLYVIKTVGGNYKKLYLVSKGYGDNYSENIFDFKYANLDGSEEQTVTLATGDYNNKNFVYYSIDSMRVVDREPPKETWDLLFSKYTDYINYDPYYHVTGVLTNEDHVEAQEVRGPGLDQATYVDYDESAFSSDISIIGGDWKKFDFATGYVLNDTVVYFIKQYVGQDSAYYKIYFTGFTGASQGKYTFMQELIRGVSVEIPGMVQMLEVYPNPASEQVHLVYDAAGETLIRVIDISGRTIHTTRHDSGGFTNLSLDISDFNPGLYFIRVEAGSWSEVVRFVKE